MTSMRNLTLLAAAAGLIGVIALAVISAPPANIELEEPRFRTPVELADGLALGRPDAPLTMEIWSDFQCPACESFTRQMEPLLVNEYVATGAVRLVYRDMSFLGPESVSAAVAARAAAEQGAFWPYHDYLFANQVPSHNVGNFSTGRLEAMAVAVGLDLDAFRAAMADRELRQAVAATDHAAGLAGVSSTPTLVIDGQLLQGVPASYAALKEIIEAALPGSSAE